MAAHLTVLALIWFWPSSPAYYAALKASLVLAPFWGWAGYLWLQQTPGKVPSRAGIMTIALSGAAASALAIWFFGRRQLGGFDHSVLVDLSWRQVSGQRPYVDFPCTLPVGFLLGGKYAFQLFGVTWSSLVAFQALFSAATFLWCFGLLRRLEAGAGLAFGLALAVQVTANVVTSYWWYNSATTAIGAVFFLSAAAFWRSPRSVLVGVSYLLSLALLATMKPNIAGVLILGVTLSLLCSRAHRWRMLGLSVAALGLFCVLLAVEGLSIHKVIRSYLSISGRGLTLQHFFEFIPPDVQVVSMMALALLLVPWLQLLVGYGRRCLSVPFGLAVAALLAGGCGFLTNGESKLVDSPLLLLALWWLVSPLTALRVPDSALLFSPLQAWVGATGFVLMMFGVTVGSLRERVELIGPFFSPTLSAQPIPTPFFAGFQGSDQLQQIDAEVTALLHQLSPRRVFFGPRMQWAYAAHDQVSPAGQPVWWHPGVAYPPADEARYVEAWAKDQMDVLVFLRDDYTYLPPSFMTVLQHDYTRLPAATYPELDVYTRLPAGTHG